jgi:hypothetical protein
MLMLMLVRVAERTVAPQPPRPALARRGESLFVQVPGRVPMVGLSLGAIAGASLFFLAPLVVDGVFHLLAWATGATAGPTDVKLPQSAWLLVAALTASMVALRFTGAYVRGLTARYANRVQIVRYTFSDPRARR